MPAEPTRIVGCISGWEQWCAAAAGLLPLPCDVVELRVDSLPPHITPADVLAHPCPKPLLVTVRDTAEGGMREMPLEERLSWARALMPAAAMLDWEIRNLEAAPQLVQEAHAHGVQLVASFHDFHATPSVQDMLSRDRAARSLGADITKFAFLLGNREDMQTGLDLMAAADGPIAVMGMGEHGAESRILFSRHGSRLVYGYLGDTPTAPGQTSAAELTAKLSK